MVGVLLSSVGANYDSSVGLLVTAQTEHKAIILDLLVIIIVNLNGICNIIEA